MTALGAALVWSPRTSSSSRRSCRPAHGRGVRAGRGRARGARERVQDRLVHRGPGHQARRRVRPRATARAWSASGCGPATASSSTTAPASRTCRCRRARHRRGRHPRPHPVRHATRVGAAEHGRRSSTSSARRRQEHDAARRVRPRLLRPHPPRTVAEVLLSYDETAAAVAQRDPDHPVRRLGGLGLLWLLLFRTVHRASRRLRFQAAENARLALLDPLTGLPNRRLFNDRLDRAAADVRAQRAAARPAAARHRPLQGRQRHPRPPARRRPAGRGRRTACSGAIRESDTVARLGGDEFAVLLPVVESVDAAEAFARGSRACSPSRSTSRGCILHVDTSMGLAVLPEHADDVTSLMARADIAMYTAKAAGARPRDVLRTEQEGGDATSRLMLLGDLRRALGTDDELHMHYQPKIDLRTGEVVGPGGAAALEPPAARLHPAGRLHPDRRADRADAAADRAGARAGREPAHVLARRGPGAAGRGEPVGAQPAASRTSTRSSPPCSRCTRCRRRCSSSRSPRARSSRTRSRPARCCTS